MGHFQFFRVVKPLALLIVALFLGACSSSGVVPKDLNLAVSNISVSQAQSVTESKRFLHELREEIRYEFSRANRGGKKARLTLDLRELAYEDLNFLGGVKDHSRMVGFGRLEYVGSGEQIGEFSVKVSMPNKDEDTNSSQGRSAIRAQLQKKMAAATLAKVYGNSRAEKISNNFASYSRESYKVRVAGPVLLFRNPATIGADIPAVANEVSTPVIIEAPQLPVDAPQVVEEPPVTTELPTAEKLPVIVGEPVAPTE